MPDHCPRCKGTPPFDVAIAQLPKGAALSNNVTCPRCGTMRAGSTLPRRGRKPDPNALRAIGRTIPAPKVHPATYARYEHNARSVGLTLTEYVIRLLEMDHRTAAAQIMAADQPQLWRELGERKPR